MAKERKEKICFNTPERIDVVLEYMRLLAGCNMSTLINAILREACLKFNRTGELPLKRKQEKE